MTLEDLVSLRPAIAELCAQYGVVELSVFGSTVRGDAGADSATPASVACRVPARLLPRRGGTRHADGGRGRVQNLVPGSPGRHRTASARSSINSSTRSSSSPTCTRR